MAKGEGHKGKIIYILKILWELSDESHPLTATQILRYLAEYGIRCERKTIYTDLDELEEFGFDIIRTRQGAYIGKRQFELPELKLLVDAVQSSRFITEKKSEELIDKLGGLLSRYESSGLKRHVLVKNRVKTMNESIYYNVDAIHEAIQKNRQIRFFYWNWNVRKEMKLKHDGQIYRVSPWVLMWENEKYYMVGYDDCAGQMKHFRVDKMLQIEVSEELRKGNAIFSKMNLPAYGIENFKMFQGTRETVTLLVENDLAGVLIDRFGRDVWMHPQDEGYFTAVVDVMVSNQFYGWIVGLGGKVRIVKPQWVADEFRELLRRMG